MLTIFYKNIYKSIPYSARTALRRNSKIFTSKDNYNMLISLKARYKVSEENSDRKK